jgi:peptidoglycan/LPS O-acetylase OafA/YrhL
MNAKWRGRIPELDGIRAIAIWMVLLMHVFNGFPAPKGSLSFLPHPVRLIIDHGWFGVDLFFLLSGFLITGILLDSKERPHYFKNFYVRRFLRIMPLYFAVVLVWSFCYRGHGLYFILSSFFGANLYTLFHTQAPRGPGVLWSLAVEEHFYLCWPAIVYLLNRRKLLILCVALFVGCPILRAIYAAKGMDPAVIYLLTWFRLDGLAGGAALAIWARSEYTERRPAWVLVAGIVAALGAITVVGSAFGLSGTKTVASVALRYTQAYLFFGAFFVLTLMYVDSKWTYWLRTPFMELTGAFSYCLYLVHHSLGDFYNFLIGRQHILHFGPVATIFARGGFLIAASYGIAAFSQKYWEGPFLALKDRFTSKTTERPNTPEPSPAAEITA